MRPVVIGDPVRDAARELIAATVMVWDALGTPAALDAIVQRDAAFHALIVALREGCPICDGPCAADPRTIVDTAPL